MRFATLLAGTDITTWRGLLPAVQHGGFWGIGIGDSPSLYPDPFLQATVAAIEAPGLHAGPWVTNPVTRHPGVMARTLHTLDVLSGGRTFLGIGVGDSAVRNLGERPAKLDELERYVVAVRDLLSEGVTRYAGTEIPFREAPRRVPIFVSTSGPRGLELAGRVADGVIIGSGLEPEMIARSKDAILTGARAGGRTLDDLELWWPVVSSIADDEQTARSQIMSHLVTYAHFGLSRPTAWHGVPDELVAGFEELGRRYLSVRHADAGKGSNADLADELGLTDFMRERFAVSGPADRVVARIEELRARGVTNLCMATRVPDKADFLARWADEVAPQVAASG